MTHPPNYYIAQQPQPQGYGPGPYPAGYYPPPQQGYYPPTQPQVIYRDERPRDRGIDPNTCWLVSLLALCCGCLIGDCFDTNCCCCLIPCALPSFGRRY
ncbi:hypothetical protein QR680_018870 [Steinernema hermaphroditum]|uniref:Cysteine-rich transmembrane CYSTM domain-containing protein n=1 Tax=Steinernema hermaphroditum TaxID=289476 RepID=A0AA39HLK3_9BILA|nr:hypothetical protein QR680_018870 [Steinernema hermaphroditum]